MTMLHTPRNLIDLTRLITLGQHAIRFLSDTEVHDAWREAASNCSKVPDALVGAVTTISTATSSVAWACSKTIAAWRRY
ncbi:hypothetical protein SAMN05216274_10587 [Cryobacterium levicorallinum]|uniref:Uncharacterized protein n=1 Tax=Cryobacterium levicorallinum TaxID=995038 RepID=A0ABY1ECG7_9MICO|nr:hypothetical protein SAMN05216274_10587 [Cryobacterium levicorallinum]